MKKILPTEHLNGIFKRGIAKICAFLHMCFQGGVVILWVFMSEIKFDLTLNKIYVISFHFS